MSRFSSVAASGAVPLILGAALTAIAFGAEGGTELTRTTVTGMLLVAVSGVVIAAAFLWGRREAVHGTTTVLLFALLALLTAASVLWSIVPELTYVEAGRTFAYVAVFAAAVAGARLAPRAAPQILLGLLIAAIVPVMYALASRVWPAALAENEVSNRLGQPFDYWNAVGCVAAIAVPICLWLGSRRTGNPILRVLAYPAMGVSVVAILLTQSRGAAAAAAVGALAWFVLVPLRLRSLPVLLLPGGAGAAVSAWALSKDPFTKAFQPLSAKEAVAGDFGALVLLMLVLLILFGAAVEAGAERRAPSARLRRRIGIAAVTVACLVPLAAFTSVAFSERGIGDRIDELTSETQVSPGEGGGRVFAASSSRGKYWREAFRVFDDRPFEGVGAGAFEKARLRHRTDASVTQHAHGWIPQTMADLGLIGLTVTTLLFLAWVLAALSATGLVPRRLLRGGGDAAPPPRRDWDADRIALVTLALVPLVYGIQSLLDWTWFIQEPTVMALIPAGYLAGLGPLGEGGDPGHASHRRAAQELAPGRARGSWRRSWHWSRRCCSRGRSGSRRPPIAPPTRPSRCWTRRSSTRRSPRRTTRRISTRSRPTHCWSAPRSTPPPTARKTRSRASNARCSCSRATRRRGTASRPSSSARSTRPSRPSTRSAGRSTSTRTRGGVGALPRRAGPPAREGGRGRTQGSTSSAHEQRARAAPSDSTSKPSSRSSRRSERRVKKRR